MPTPRHCLSNTDDPYWIVILLLLTFEVDSSAPSCVPYKSSYGMPSSELPYSRHAPYCVSCIGSLGMLSSELPSRLYLCCSITFCCLLSRSHIMTTICCNCRFNCNYCNYGLEICIWPWLGMFSSELPHMPYPTSFTFTYYYRTFSSELLPLCCCLVCIILLLHKSAGKPKGMLSSELPLFLNLVSVIPLSSPKVLSSEPSMHFCTYFWALYPSQNKFYLPRSSDGCPAVSPASVFVCVCDCGYVIIHGPTNVPVCHTVFHPTITTTTTLVADTTDYSNVETNVLVSTPL